ncbi:M23 family metallopeptidase [Georgenia sp. TF02-10]|uniref:M23 family metallopeptidase n=1 Tax=Georgenia sp. TF02-10 TaxID=2917725 RepID=UPI001FA76811|nr:M23 family metallopeptidase [Georgenia sp. TF02-10]UNX53181.1 M23 family metallopeptidase [Georgenia sp. TF02-10]
MTALTRAVRRLYRVRTPVLAVAVLLVLLPTAARAVLPDGPVHSALAPAPLVGAALLALVLLLGVVGRPAPPEGATTVTTPVRGRWLALNSPATRVPSHGVRAYGQAYAIDLVHEPADGARPAFGAGRAMPAARDYPAFGQPVLAMTDGVVVAASDRQRDHRARASWPSLLYMMAEGAVRELGGPRFVVGNHVVVRSADGTYALLAHLRRGSLRVRPGQQVRAGQELAECGNSGNTSEPHVHAQLMDRASLWTAQGLPLAFRDVLIDGDDRPRDGVPANGEHLVAVGPADPASPEPGPPVPGAPVQGPSALGRPGRDHGGEQL